MCLSVNKGTGRRNTQLFSFNTLLLEVPILDTSVFSYLSWRHLSFRCVPGSRPLDVSLSVSSRQLLV